MFYTVKQKVDKLFEEGYITRYDSPQIVWERLRAGEPVLFKLMKGGRAARQFIAEPDKLGVHFREIPAVDDYCRFHEHPIKEEGEDL
jgi:phenylalanine-4-hydroxylase